MKKIFIVFILLSTAAMFGQDAYLLNSDSILVKRSSRRTYSIITIVDSSDSKTDSLVFEIFNNTTKNWNDVAGMDMSTHDDWFNPIVPGDGVEQVYLANFPFASDNFRVRRINVEVGQLARRTRVIIEDR